MDLRDAEFEYMAGLAEAGCSAPQPESWMSEIQNRINKKPPRLRNIEQAKATAEASLGCWEAQSEVRK